MTLRGGKSRARTACQRPKKKPQSVAAAATKAPMPANQQPAPWTQHNGSSGSNDNGDDDSNTTAKYQQNTKRDTLQCHLHNASTTPAHHQHTIKSDTLGICHSGAAVCSQLGVTCPQRVGERTATCRTWLWRGGRAGGSGGGGRLGTQGAVGGQSTWNVAPHQCRRRCT